MSRAERRTALRGTLPPRPPDGGLRFVFGQVGPPLEWGVVPKPPQLPPPPPSSVLELVRTLQSAPTYAAFAAALGVAVVYDDVMPMPTVEESGMAALLRAASDVLLNSGVDKADAAATFGQQYLAMADVLGVSSPALEAAEDAECLLDTLFAFAQFRE